MKAKILLVEGKHTDRPSFVSGLTKKGYQVESTPNGSAALLRLKDAMPNVVIVDAASMRTSGKRICQSLRKQYPDLPIVLILDENAENDDKGTANILLRMPFTPQKLINRIKPLLPARQADVLQAGPLQLDMQHRIVRCNNKQARLTPRLMTLLRIFMEHPGEVLERQNLFCQVWETTYAGDMRTLDVHVSWLRQAIEEDPRHPVFLVTLRGQGYRLDINTPTQPE